MNSGAGRRLHRIQQPVERNLKWIADKMAAYATQAVDLPQERWEQMSRAWDVANTKVQEIGEAIERAAREAGVLQQDQ
jgi:hypothetical protein